MSSRAHRSISTLRAGPIPVVLIRIPAGLYVAADGPKRKATYFVVAALAGIVLLTLALLILAVLAQVAVAGVTVWASVGLLHYANLVLLLRRKQRKLSMPAQLDRLKASSMRAGLISAAIREERLHFADPLFYTAAVVTAGVGCFQLQQTFTLGGFAGLIVAPGVSIPASVCALFAVPITAGVAGVIHQRFRGSDRLHSYLATKLSALLDPLNQEIAATSAEWNLVESKIAALADSLHIRPPDAELPKILASLERRLDAVCAESFVICRELWDAREAARIDRTELEGAWRSYQSAETAARAAEIKLAGAPSAFAEALARYRNRLHEPETRELLTHRNWTAYRILTRALREEIAFLPDLVVPAPSEPRLPPPPEGQEPPVRNDRDRAYRILRLPIGAEAQEIQRAYRWLSSVWHPDRRLAADDSEMKAINWAYRYLKNSGDA